MRLQREHGSAGLALVGPLLVLSILSVSRFPAVAQDSAYPKTPRAVLEAYRKMDAEGERLTPAGWYRASIYFVRPDRPPGQVVMYVTDGERVTDLNPWIRGNNRVEVSAVCSAIGQIDSSGRFTPVVAPGLTDPPGPGDAQIRGPAPLVRPYALVLTDTHWEFGPKLEGPREVKGSPEWRIETFEPEPWVTVAAAIRYLTRLHDESSSETIKGNADKSIATLRRLP